MWVDADIGLGIWAEGDGMLVDDATAMLIDGSMLKFREFTAVKLFFLVNGLDAFVYSLGLSWSFSCVEFTIGLGKLN